MNDLLKLGGIVSVILWFTLAREQMSFLAFSGITVIVGIVWLFAAPALFGYSIAGAVIIYALFACIRDVTRMIYDRWRK